MKKHFVITLFVLLFCNVLMAQKPPGVSGFQLYERDYKICIGPILGGGLAMPTATAAYDFNPKVGLSYQGGLAINGRFGHRQRFGFGGGGTGLPGFEVEVLFSRRTMSEDGTTMAMNCIEMPLLAQIYPIVQLGLEAGVTFVRMLGFTPEYTQTNYAVLYTGQIKGGDVMLTTGVCFQPGFGLMVDARYNFGISPIAGNLNTKVSTIVVSVAYLIKAVK